MKKERYTAPMAELIRVESERPFALSKYNIDGVKDIIEGNPEGEIDAKEQHVDPWGKIGGGSWDE